MTIELGNEKKKKVGPVVSKSRRESDARGHDSLEAEHDATNAERDYLIAERDRLRGLVDTRGTQIEQLSENLGAVTKELGTTRCGIALREDKLTH